MRLNIKELRDKTRYAIVKYPHLFFYTATVAALHAATFQAHSPLVFRTAPETKSQPLDRAKIQRSLQENGLAMFSNGVLDIFLLRNCYQNVIGIQLFCS